MRGNTKTPFSFETTERTSPVASLVTFISTPGIRAADTSITVPVNAPVEAVCEKPNGATLSTIVVVTATIRFNAHFPIESPFQSHRCNCLTTRTRLSA